MYWISTYVKSPVASLCFVCSSVRNLVKVTISVLMLSVPTPVWASPLFCPLVAMLDFDVCEEIGVVVENN